MKVWVRRNLLPEREDRSNRPKNKSLLDRYNVESRPQATANRLNGLAETLPASFQLIT